MSLFHIHFKAHRLLPLAAAGLLVAVSAFGASATEPPIPSGSSIPSWYANGTGGHYIAPVISGSMQSLAPGSRVGTVLTDTNCTPDIHGLSHCYNSIAFGGGEQITVQDNHQMSRHRCLRPGEQVRVSLFKGRWVTVQTRL